MRNLRVSVRAALSFAFITLLLITLGGISVWKMGQIRDTARSLENDGLASILVAEKINVATLRLRLENRRLIDQTDPEEVASTLNTIDSVRENFKAQIKAYAPFVTSEKREDFLNPFQIMVKDFSRRLITSYCS